MNYINEHDEYAAQWCRNLIAAGHIAPAVVDTRSIEDVTPADLAGFTQCHFFAGAGIWSYALRMAGWPDDRPVWTGSCPCQPFSASGKGAGFDDDRHLWPSWQWLIAERKPAIIFGEQVASKDAEPWFDLVATDLEGLGYACGAVPFPAAGVGAPNIRDRLYWVAHAGSIRRQDRSGYTGHVETAGGSGETTRHKRLWSESGAICGSEFIGMADTDHAGLEGRQQQSVSSGLEWPTWPGGVASGVAGPVNGFWRGADWLACRDDKWRPVEPGTFPLADGYSSRVGRLRAYGNALNAQAAIAFIEVAMECMPQC